MTGEKVDPREDPQPGGRKPAPGRLGVLQAFTNTHYDLTGDRGGEVWRDPDELMRWVKARGLVTETTLDARDLWRARAVREGLRALALANNDQRLDTDAVAAMNDAAAHSGAVIRLDASGPTFAGAGEPGIEPVLGEILIVAARSMIEGTWPRVKACPGRDCGWSSTTTPET